MSASKLRCLLVHNRYLQQGGEDIVVQEEKLLLEKYGHKVKLYEIDNQQIDGILKKIQTGINITYSANAKSLFSNEIAHFQPDIIHIHNFFPLLTPSIYDACIEANIPCIQTLHNYRLICPGALLMCEGKVCERCIQGTPYNAVLHKCYRNSRIESFAVARMVAFHRRKNTWSEKVSRFIALTEFSKSKFVAAGFPPSKIIVKPNFVNQSKSYPKTKTDTDIENHHLDNEKNNYALFVGRLSEEKGIVTLFDAWESIDMQLHVVGSGSPQESIPNKNKRIKFLGKLSKAEVQAQMANARFLIMPSICYENLPLVIIEAFSCGLPVVASNLGAMKEIVEHKKTGLLFKPGDSVDLAEKINYLLNNPNKCNKMRINARTSYLENFTPQKNYELLISIYQEAINDKSL